MPDLEEIVAGFLLGLLGSGHCVAMCGGLVGAASGHASPGIERARSTTLTFHLLLSLGRIISYATAGALVGSIGLAALMAFGDVWGLWIRGLGGVILILLGLGPWVDRPLPPLIDRFGMRAWRLLSPQLMPWANRLRSERSPWAAIALGALWGWLPCGLVYAALGWATSAADPALASLRMLAFGLGTLPALLLLGAAGERLVAIASRKAARRALGALLIVFGIWTIIGYHPPSHAGHAPGGDTHPAAHAHHPS